MALDALWAVLIPEVSEVSQVQAPIHAGFGDTPAVLPEVSRVSSNASGGTFTVMPGGIDTPATPPENVRYQRKPAWALGCTLDTPDTPEKINAKAHAENELLSGDLLTGWNVTIPPGTSPATLAKFRAASLGLDAAQRAASVPPLGDPDANCWPASKAMTGAEIDTFTARLAQFTDKGLTLDAGERLADKLVIRDRERDDRRHCLECTHLHRGDGWRCGNWQRAGVALRARDAQLPTDFVNLLQRCDGFSDAVQIQREGCTL